MFELQKVHFSYGDKEILKGVSFTVKKGEIIALIGVSGSGKTTLFRLISGLLKPSSGKILIDQAPLSDKNLLTTYMRQEDLLLPWRTVRGNLLLFTELGKRAGRGDLESEALSLLKEVGLEGCEELYPHQLSGGMRQRVALARTLLQNRPLLLLDEPFASLDVIMREQLYTLIRQIRERHEKTVVMVTHDFRDALALADHILILAQGEVIGHYPAATPGLLNQIRSDLLESTRG